MDNKVSKFSVGIVCALLGFLIVFQVKSSKATSSSTYNSTDLKANIDNLKTRKDELNSANSILKEKVTDLEEAAAEANEEGQEIKDELFYQRVNLGIIDVTGDGISIIIKPKNTMFGQTGKETSKSIDENDLVKIVDSLWFGGAEAIAINDIRVTIQTGISTSGSEILIGSSGKINTADTLTIKAIGDFDKMKSNLSKEFSVMSNTNLVQNYIINMENTKGMVIEKASQSILSEHLNDIHSDEEK